MNDVNDEADATRHSLPNKAPMSLIVFAIFDHHWWSKIIKTIKLIGALLEILEDRRGPPFFCLPSLRCHKQKKVSWRRKAQLTQYRSDELDCFCNLRSSLMIEDSKNNQSHWSFISNVRGPSRSSFFLFAIASMSQTKKSKGIRISLRTYSFCNVNFYTYVPYKSSSANVLFLKMPVFLHFEIWYLLQN